MATKPPSEPMAIVSCSGEYLVTFEQAVTVAKALHSAPRVDRDWTSDSWKIRTDRNSTVEIKLLHATDMAKIALNSDS